MEKKKIIVREGTFAIYKNNAEELPVVLCNVKRDQYGITFNARDRKTKALIRHNGYPMMWVGDSIYLGTFIIENPEYEEDFIYDENKVEVDELKKEKEILGAFFENNVKFDNSPFYLDDEQLTAVLSEQNSLITARAGSGKTRILIAKLIYLFEKQKMNDKNVLTFCFNRDASIEISDRLNNRCKINDKIKYQNYDIAKTFHSFAKKSLNLAGKILQERVRLIKLILNDLRRNDLSFAKNVYQFFRKETLRIDRKNFNSNEAYYKYIRNSEYTTLNGEKVKSKSEKYIADYFFEHGIEYIYEKSFYPYKISFEDAKLNEEEIQRCINFISDKKEIIPDFYLPDYDIVWEHWALEGNEKTSEIENFEKLIGNYNEYIQNKEWKKKFWSKYWRSKLSFANKYNKDIKSIKTLIETTQKQLSLESRTDIENQIEKVLINNKIYAKKLPESILVEKVWNKCIDGFTILIEQFINKLQQNYFDDINIFLNNINLIQDDKMKMYYELGYKVYKKYIKILASDQNCGQYENYNEYKFDFNQIIYECSKKIIKGELDDQISQLKWLLIDEYQDFSRLFDFLINSILTRNKDIKIFCVGDDWQAINRFAGSDIKYFKNFSIRYDNAKLFNIKTNYRSENHIVQFANKFMKKCGVTGGQQISKIISTGISSEIDISSIYIGQFNDNNIYLKVLDENERNKVEKAKYLKACENIIKNNLNKKIMILNRSNMILGQDIEDFNKALKALCLKFMSLENYNNNIFVKTVHKSKGEEADTVILLNINQGVFPVFNANNDLFEIFGHSTIEAVEDEERLYYVAITRAKRNLYILYENKIKSPFIMS